MSKRVVAVLAVTGLLAGVVVATSLSRSPVPIETMAEVAGPPHSFADLPGSAYVVSGTFQGTERVGFDDMGFAVIVELENPTYLGDDSPETPTQTPAPLLSKGETISIWVDEFDLSGALAQGDRVVAIVAHNSDFDPPWITQALGRGGDDDVTMIGLNAEALNVELAAVASSLKVDREQALWTLAAEQLEADDRERAGEVRSDSLGPALAVAASTRDDIQLAASGDALWDSVDPAIRGLQRGVAPDALLDELPELSVVYTVSDDFIKKYPDMLIQVRNELGITSSIEAAIGEASDTVYGSPGGMFEVTLVKEGSQKSANVIGPLEASKWNGAYALAIVVDIDRAGDPVVNASTLTETQFTEEIEKQTGDVAFDTAEEAEQERSTD